MPKKKQSFEQAMAKLENIVGLMEDPGAGLENLMNYFHEAVDLARFLDTTLAGYEHRVTELIKTAEGFTEKTFEGERNDG